MSCQSKGTAAVITPDTPPTTNRTMKPSMNFIGAGYHGLPSQSVASHEKTATALGMVIMRLAAPKNASARGGIPVANMWCSHTPKPSIAVVTVASATKV